MRGYLASVAWCLKHRILTALAAGAFFVGSIMLVPLLPTGFIPPDDFGQTQVSIELPPGSTFDDTSPRPSRRARWSAPTRMCKRVYTAIGGRRHGGCDPFAGGGGSEVRKATLTINLTPRKPTARASQADHRRRAAPGHAAAARRAGQGRPGRLGRGLCAGAVGRRRRRAGRGRPRGGTRPAHHPRHGQHHQQRQPGAAGAGAAARCRPRGRPGVTTAAMADTLRIATTGDYDSSLPKLNLAQRQVPIVVKLPQRRAADLALLGQLTVPGKPAR
jgi:multidrug efflux pump subunit AcrB